MAAISLQMKQSSPTAMRLVNENFSVTVDRPIEKGGGGTGLMGGQYLLIGVGGCFCSNLFAAAVARDVKITGLAINITAIVSDGAPKRFTDIRLDASYETCSAPGQFSHLLSIAQKACISVHTITKGVNLQITTENSGL